MSLASESPGNTRVMWPNTRNWFASHSQVFVKLALIGTVYLTRGQSYWKELHFKLHVGMDLEKDRNKAGMRKLTNTTLLQNDGGLLSGLQAGMRERKKTTLHLQIMGSRCRVVFLLLLTPAWRPEMRPPSSRSRVVLLSFLIPALFLSFSQVDP